MMQTELRLVACIVSLIEQIEIRKANFNNLVKIYQEDMGYENTSKLDE